MSAVARRERVLWHAGAKRFLRESVSLYEPGPRYVASAGPEPKRERYQGEPERHVSSEVRHVSSARPVVPSVRAPVFEAARIERERLRRRQGRTIGEQRKGHASHEVEASVIVGGNRAGNVYPLDDRRRRTGGGGARFVSGAALPGAGEKRGPPPTTAKPEAGGREGGTRSCLGRSYLGPNVTAGGAKALRDGWSRFIRNFASWDWFVTLTFKSDVSTETARRTYLRWLGRLAQSLGKSGRPVRVKWVLAVEPTIAGRWHLHALLSADGLIRNSRFAWEERWERVGGGLARIHPAVRKAAPYLTKYIAKDGDIEAGIFS